MYVGVTWNEVGNAENNVDLDDGICRNNGT